MKYIDEYREADTIKQLSIDLKNIFNSANFSSQLNIMEICGGQTHSIMKYGLEELLPKGINLLHGPGCPVCVTAAEDIDKAVTIAKNENVILTAFGDMLRVPGNISDLLKVKAQGGDVRIILSPLESVSIAENNPDKEVVFFAVGFETTIPAIAAALIQAKKKNLQNYSVIASNVLVPPAIEFLLQSPLVKIDAFLAAGHVCTVMGYNEYIPISEKYNVPITVTGFEPADILLGIIKSIQMLKDNNSTVVNAYTRAVKKDGNKKAIELVNNVFEPCDSSWRGIGLIPKSGMKLNSDFNVFNFEEKYKLNLIKNEGNNICIAGEILMGIKKPSECQAFGKICTPQNPLGAPMVSSEGACSAYYRYGK